MIPRSPLSVRVCEAGCVGFALWTLCAHAVVAAGGTLAVLVASFAVAGGAIGAGAWLLRRRGALEAAPPPDANPISALDPARWKRQAAGGAIAAVALVLAWPAHPTLVWGVWCAALASAAALFVWRDPVLPEAPASGRSQELALWAVAALCAVYALVAHRADADDAFYVNLAVAAIDRPDLPLLAVDTLHGREDLPIHFPVYRLHSLELAYAALAWLTGVPAIAVFHLFGAALWAVALPLAHAVLLRWLLPRSWLAATLALVFVLCVVGETHRWYGNFALLRIWQGKAVLLFVFLPLVQAFAIRFALRPTGRHLALLATAQIAALGCSANALWLAPLAAGFALLCALPASREGLRRASLGALGSLYCVAAGLLFRGAMVARTPTLARGYEPGELLRDAVERTLGDGALAALGVAAIGASWALCRPGIAQRFAICVPLGATLLLLCPFADGLVRAWITGPAYWRAMWLVPVPLLLALAIASPLSLAPRRRGRATIASLALALGFALFVPRHFGWSEANEVSLRFPGLKRPPNVARWATLVNLRAPRQRVLAPPAVSDWIPTEHDHAYPLMVRDYLRPSREQVGDFAYRERAVMTRYVGGRIADEDAPEIFARGLELYGVRLVCLRVSKHAPTQRAILERAGFARSVTGRHYEIWERGSPQAIE